MDLTVEVREEADGYWAHVRDLPGCFASGRTLDELGDAVAEAVGLYLWDRPATLGDQKLQVGDVPVKVEQPDRG